MVSELLLILTALILAFICSQLAKKIGLPRTVGEITAGLILSIGVIKALVATPETLGIFSFLANLGVILLFYYVGLETNFKTFRQNVKESITISLLNTTLPLILGFLILHFLLHFDSLVSIILGICLSVSAQAVSIDILEELGLLKSKLGNRIITTGAVDDTIELILVSIILSIVHFSINSISPLQLALNCLLFIAAAVLIRIFLLPPILKTFENKTNFSSTSRFMISLILVFLIVVISETLDLGPFVGAIVAGAMVRQTIFTGKKIPFWEEHDMSKSIHIVAFGFLIPLFFVWVGMNTNFAQLLNIKDVLFILLLTGIAIVGTVGGTALAVKLNKGTWKEGFILGWGLNPKGDTELVIAALALQTGIIQQEIFSAVVLMSFITTIISPIIFRKLLEKAKKEKLIATHTRSKNKA